MNLMKLLKLKGLTAPALSLLWDRWFTRFLVMDMAVTEKLTYPKTSRWFPIARMLAHLGDGSNVLLGLLLTMELSYLLNLRSLWQTTIIACLAVMVTAVTVTSIKFVVRRTRPRPPGEFVQYQYDSYSFPSGHAARMATLGTGMMGGYPMIGLGLLGIAGLVALARVWVGVHYVSDIIVGFLVGLLVAGGCIYLF